MTSLDTINPLKSLQLISMDSYFNEMIHLYESKKFPKVLLLSGKKGIGKFTLIFHFLNYIFTLKDKNSYNLEEKIINTNSSFYNQFLSQTNQDVILIKAEENKNIKIEDIRNLKSTISQSPLNHKPRFIVIDEIEFFNESSVSALLKSLEEPSSNNFFILINNQQAPLIKTISSRCITNNIFLNKNDKDKITSFLLKTHNVKILLDYNFDLTPGLYLRFNDICFKLNIDKNDSILNKINKLLNGYKKNKDRVSIQFILFLIDQYFYKLAQSNEKQIDFLMKIKSNITSNINDFINYNLNVNSVLNSIEMKLKNVQ